MMKQRARLTRLLSTLAERMRERRRSLGLTQAQLAERSGLSTNYIARLEIADKTPSLSTLVSLAEALEVDVSELLAPRSGYPWQESAQEVARMMDSLSEQDSRFVLNQIQAIVNYIRSLRKD